jgi:hypothetical protein
LGSLTIFATNVRNEKKFKAMKYKIPTPYSLTKSEEELENKMQKRLTSFSKNKAEPPIINSKKKDTNFQQINNMIQINQQDKKYWSQKKTQFYKLNCI